MLSKIYFVVEGEHDKKFLIDFAKIAFNEELNSNNFLVTKGYNQRWVNQNLPKIQEAKIQGFKPVLFLDADTNFERRRSELDRQLSLDGIQLEYFLFPDNKSNGDLEEAILRLVNSNHLTILACFEQYKTCLGAYSKPNNKAKLFAYFEAASPSSSMKIDFSDRELWDISSKSLPELRTFLTGL